MRSPRAGARGVQLAAAAALLFWPAAARAGGFATARFGGEHSTAADVLPSALYYNPGAIGFLDGQQLMLDAVFALHTAQYRRDARAIDDSTLEAVESAGLDRDEAIAALTGEGEVNDWLLSPFAGVTSDLGLSRSPVRIGAAFYVPFGGQSSWDEEAPNATFPGAEDGPGRWYSIEGTIRSFAVTLGVAYKIEPARLSLGVTGNLYINEVHTLRARNANATDNLVASDGSLVEGRSLLDVSGIGIGIGAGALWEPVADVLWLGASYQSQPGFGELELDGTLDNTLGAAPPAEPEDVVFTEELPDIFRIAGRIRPIPVLELRLQLSWERWSQLEQMCLVRADADVDAACATRSDGSLVDDSSLSDVVQIFQRDWDDTINVHASASVFIGALELLGGIRYDSNAIPDRTLDPALYDMDKLTVALGASYELGETVTLSLTLSDVIYFERDTRGIAGNAGLERPSRQPSNAGRYTQNAFLLQPALALAF